MTKLAVALSALSLVGLRSVGQSVPQLTTTSILASDIGTAGQQTVKIVASVRAGSDLVTAGQVTFVINGRPYQSAQIVGIHHASQFNPGTATVLVPLPPGPYTITARYSGTKNWTGSTSATATVIVPTLAQASLTIGRSPTHTDVYRYRLSASGNSANLPDPIVLSDLATGSTLSSADLGKQTSDLVTSQKDHYLAFPATSLSVSDLSGNGTSDFAICNGAAGTVEIFLQQSDGSRPLSQSIPVGTQPTAVLASDLNEDGLPDLVVVNTGDNTVSIVLQDASRPGTFMPATSVQVGNMPIAAAIGDFNRDGLLDLAVANFADDTISILLNNSFTPGSFVPGPIINTQGGPTAIATGDLTRKGLTDLAVTNYYDGTISVFAASPSTSNLFNEPTFVNKVGKGPRSLLVTDLNGDGLADLVSANSLDGTISVLPAKPDTPGMYPVQYIVDGFSQPTSIVPLWSPGSTSPDIAVSDGVNGSITVLKNDRSGRFLQRSVFVAGSGLSAMQTITSGAAPGMYLVAALDPSLEIVHLLSSQWILSGVFPAIKPLDSSLSHKLQASYASPAYGDLTSNVVTIAAHPKRSQSIAFNALPAKVYGAAPVPLSATATSDLPVQFSIKSGEAEITGNALTIKGAGVISIEADQAGNSSYSAAPPVLRTLFVDRAVLAITPSSAIRKYGAANPTFTGTVSGIVGADVIRTSYSSRATSSTPAGVYASAPFGISAAVSDSPLIANYVVKATIGILTICPAPAAARSAVIRDSFPKCPVHDNLPGAPIAAPPATPPVSAEPARPKSPVVVPVPILTSPVKHPVKAGPSPVSSPVSVLAPPNALTGSTSTTNSASSPVVQVGPISNAPKRPERNPKRGGLRILPVPIPFPILTFPVPSLPSLGLGAPRIVIVSKGERRTSSLLLLIDKRVPDYFGWVAISLSLNCSTGATTRVRVTIADRDSAIATVTLKPRIELDTRIRLNRSVQSELTAHFEGNQWCDVADSKTVVLSALPVQRISTVDDLSGSYLEALDVPAFQPGGNPESADDSKQVKGPESSDLHQVGIRPRSTEEDSY